MANDLVKFDEQCTAIESAGNMLSDQQRAFATRYMLDYNVRAAGADVGLPYNEAILALRDPGVMAYINELSEAREKLALIGKDFVVYHWINILPMLKGEVSVPLVTKSGSEFEAKKFHASEYVRALTELSVISGLKKPYAEGDMAKGKVNITLNFGGLERPVIEIENE
jgi:hypothetical protein